MIHTSPSSPCFRTSPFSFIIHTSGPAGRPTNPAFCCFGGNGLEVIWCVASVIPYASITGQLKTSFKSLNTAGGKDADDDLINLSLSSLAISEFLRALNKIVWCIVGTPEYQFIFSDFARSRNLIALNPSDAQTEAPALIDEAKIAIRPWIWKSGIIFRQWSLSERFKLLEIYSAEEKIFLFVKGTIFGLDVVPDVWSTNDSSFSSGKEYSVSFS